MPSSEHAPALRTGSPGHKSAELAAADHDQARVSEDEVLREAVLATLRTNR
jgi:hypothetical protein